VTSFLTAVATCVSPVFQSAPHNTQTNGTLYNEEQVVQNFIGYNGYFSEDSPQINRWFISQATCVVDTGMLRSTYTDRLAAEKSGLLL
jgi:hypothetical protein